MLRLLLLLVFAAALTSPVAAQGIAPVHGKANWYIVTGSAESSGAACLVRSLGSGQVLGQIEPESKFMAFGTDGKITTLAFNGVIGYIPAAAATELYPFNETPAEYHAYGKTLEQQRQDIESRQKDSKNQSLMPKSYGSKKAVNTADGTGAGAGLGTGAGTNNGQPSRAGRGAGGGK